MRGLDPSPLLSLAHRLLPKDRQHSCQSLEQRGKRMPTIVGSIGLNNTVGTRDRIAKRDNYFLITFLHEPNFNVKKRWLRPRVSDQPRFWAI
jgi:hypothetical protein